jgi:small subunit ribosomal protein S2
MDMGKMPGALFIVDIKKEHIAVAEAKKLGIPTIGLVDTNSNPNVVDYPIPGNDDAAKSIYVIANAIATAIKEGSSDNRKTEKDAEPVRSKEDELITETPTVSEVVVEEA